ncbi:hypothetical protein DFP72DRAFT_1059536 [Ephemerocybe angulata]|uniref:Uncharacterized protein n=1 Tax=Ephemerocybe angulata TaxID=980116 RepID=A0A8H6MH22_9AGAR|nr:hypothetical protein DFP72DRAFT_1059536 [Tulosesus angulatus]
MPPSTRSHSRNQSLNAPVFTTPCYDVAIVQPNTITTTVVHDNGTTDLAAVEAICPFFYQLKDRDFILVAHQYGQNVYALNNKLISAIEWSSEGLINTTIEAAAGPTSVGHMRDLPDILFTEIGMTRPELMAQGANNVFSPLRNFGTRDALVTLFKEQQRRGLEMAKWMLQARQKAVELGPLCRWQWNQRTLELEIAPIVAQDVENEGNGEEATEDEDGDNDGEEDEDEDEEDWE